MKKFFAFLLILYTLLSLIACKSNTDHPNEKENRTDLNNHITTQTATTAPNETQESPEKIFKEDEVLFYAEDRADIEGDRNQVYAYNYKGDLLFSKDMYDIRFMGPFGKCGLAVANSPQTEKVGYIDKSGVFKIEPTYSYAAPFSDSGIALVAKLSEENGRAHLKYGYINAEGEEIIPCIYDYATSFYTCGYALAKVQEFKEVERQFEHYSGEIHTYTEWECVGEIQYVINEQGKSVFSVDVGKENYKISHILDDCFVCESLDQENEHVTVFDFSGKKIAESSSTYKFDVWSGENSLCLTGKQKTLIRFNLTSKETNFFIDGKWINGNDLFPPFTRKQVATTESGYGYGLEKNGEILISFAYDEILICNDYFVAIKKGKSWLESSSDIYDQNYKKVAEIPYRVSGTLWYYGDGSNNIALPNGYFVIESEYDDEHVYGIIDITGKTIVPLLFYRPIYLCTYEGEGQFDWFSSSLGHSDDDWVSYYLY